MAALLNWRSCLKYPLKDFKIEELLDTLEGMLDTTEFLQDRFCYMSELLDTGKNLGLITGQERSSIQFKIANLL